MKSLYTILILLTLGLASSFFTEDVSNILGSIRKGVLGDFGWMMNATIMASVFIAAVLAFNSKYANIKLPGEKRIGNLSWYGMCVSTVIGSSLFVWGVSEPSYHVEAGFETTDAIARTMYNWGPAYIMFAVATAAGGIFWSKGRAVFTPNMGKKATSASMVLMCVTTVIAIVSSFTIAASGVQSGLKGTFGIDVDLSILMVVFAIISLASAKSGVLRGVKWLSNGAMATGVIITAAVAWFVGMDTLKYTFQSFGLMLSNLFEYGFDTGAGASEDHNGWLFWWPYFYAAWWFTFLPFSVAFFTTISQGRTVREVIVGVGVIPMVITCFFFGVLGSAAEILEVNDPFVLLEQVIPYGEIAGGVLLVAMCLWMVTCVDSGSIALDEMSEGKTSSGCWVVFVAFMAISFQMFGPEAWNALKIVIAILGLPIAALYLNMVVQAFKMVK